MASSGRYLVVWEDRRNGNSDIYGARVDKNGQVLASDKFGLKLATGGNYQMSPRVACQKETCLVTFAHGSFATAMTSIRSVRLETINKVFTVVDNPGIFLASVYRVAAPYAVTDSSGNFAVFWRIYQLNSASYIKALLFKP